MKKMGKALLLATATGLISMASFSCRTPDDHGDHPTDENASADSDHPTDQASEHPTEHPAEHPTEHPTEHPADNSTEDK